MKTIVIKSGHVSSGLVIGAHQQLEVLSGGVAIDTHLTGSMTVELGGSASATIISSGGFEAVSGATVSGTTVLKGGTEQLFNGLNGKKIVPAVAVGTVLSGGVQDVGPHTRAVSTYIATGATQYVYSTGIASQTTVGSGGVQLVEAGSAAGVSVRAGGQERVVFIGAEVTGITVHAGAFEFVGSGAASTGTVQSGGTLVLLPGATLGAMTIAAGGAVVSTGVVIGTVKTLEYAPTLQGGTIEHGTEYVLSQGTAISALVGSQGTQAIYPGGTASATQVSAGGMIEMLDGGLLTSAVLLSGAGLQADFGEVLALTVSQGANASIYPYGTLIGATVAGTLIDYSGYGDFVTVVSGVSVQSGGVFLISQHGSVAPDNTIIHAGGTLLLAAVGFVSGFTSAVFNAATDVLSVGGLDLQLASSYAGEHFVAAAGPPDEGTEVTLVPDGGMATMLERSGGAWGTSTASLHPIISG